MTQRPTGHIQRLLPGVLVNEYRPRAVEGFRPERIVLAKGSSENAARRAMCEGISRAYPEAEVIDLPHVPHNRGDLGETDPLRAHGLGKRTLVLGVHHSAVRQSSEDGNMCPNYWHFSPYGFCPYGCHYCYLAGTQGVRFSPTVKVFLNLPEILSGIDRVARRIAQPTAFYLGKLQDGLALDPLTGYSRILVPYFAAHPLAWMVLLTKSANVENLLDLKHAGHTILSWTLNPTEVIAGFEANTPPLARRIEAMRKCAQAGYPVRAVIMPLIPVTRWQDLYARFLEDLLTAVPLERITFGGICSYPNARSLMEQKLGQANPISRSLDDNGRSADGRARYDLGTRLHLYGCLIEAIQRLRPSLNIGLCLEERSVFNALGLAEAIGRCNCVL